MFSEKISYRAGSERVVKLVIYIGVVSFLLYCLRIKLGNDFEAAQWLKLAKRFSIALLLGALILWRINTSELRLPLLVSRQGLVVIMFLAFLFYPLISHYSAISRGVEKTAQTITRKNDGAGIAKFLQLKSFPSEFESKREKFFSLSKTFIHFNALIKVHILGVSPNKNVAVGKNGFYFEGWGARKVERGIVENFDNIADYMGQIPFSPAELRRWKQTLEERQYWLNEKGVRYAFVLAPTKALVYPEYLPSSLQRVNQGITRYQQLSAYLKDYTSLHFVDLLPPLLETKETQPYPLLFYKTDFHWNFFGAFIAYREIVTQLEKEIPELSFRSPDLDEFDLEIDENWAHPRFLNMIGLPERFHRNEHYLTFIPKPATGYDQALDLPEGGIQDVYPREVELDAPGNKPLKIRMIRNPGAEINSLLLLGDSFFEKCVYFFSGQAKEVYNYRTIVNFPYHIFRYEKPELVIQEILNMFLLRKPPLNPPRVAKSYPQKKYHDSRQLARYESHQLTVSVSSHGNGTAKIAIELPDQKTLAAGEFRTVKIKLLSKTPGTYQFVSSSNSEAPSQKRTMRAGKNVVYTLLSPHHTNIIELMVETAREEGIPEIDSVSVRTDLKE